MRQSKPYGTNSAIGGIFAPTHCLHVLSKAAPRADIATPAPQARNILGHFCALCPSYHLLAPGLSFCALCSHSSVNLSSVGEGFLVVPDSCKLITQLPRCNVSEMNAAAQVLTKGRI